MGNATRQLAVLGSTGSIGQQTLDVVRAFPERFRVVGLAAGRNTGLLREQVREFKPRFVCSADRLPASDLKESGCELLPIEEMAGHPEVDITVIAASGKAGLIPTLSAVRVGKTIALANKESLVMAGGIIIAEARKSGAQVRPVDSEHSAIWQCLQGESCPPERIVLTASGGPFYRYSPEQMRGVTVEQALKHPSWQMGKKITIDSATLMNKGLEVIEAHWLFNMPIEKIEVIVHPQSIVHSMIEFADGALKAQLSWPDMRLPIQYALTYPERLANDGLPKLDWSTVSEFTFEQPDMETFPCLRLAIEAGKQGKTYPAVLSAADEVAVDLFLCRRIRFTDIATLVEKTLEAHQPVAEPILEDIFAADAWARERVMQFVTGDS